MTGRPEHLAGPEWDRWQAVYVPTLIRIVPNVNHPGLQDFIIADKLVAWLEPRPYYCDRGHWKVGTELPGIDGSDSFPRYYMSETCAKLETITWLNWRLWRVRVS